MTNNFLRTLARMAGTLASSLLLTATGIYGVMHLPGMEQARQNMKIGTKLILANLEDSFPTSHPQIDEIQKSLSEAPLTIIGDNHNSPLPMRYLASDEFLESAQSNGKKYIAIEVEKQFQGLFDDLRAGKIDRAQFVQTMDERSGVQMFDNSTSHLSDAAENYNNLASLIEQSKRWGIKILCVDDGSPLGQLKDTKFGQYASKFSDQPNGITAQQWTDYIDTHPDDYRDFVSKLVEIRQSPETNRLILNHTLAAMKGSPSSDNGVILFFGDAHIKPLQKEAVRKNIKSDSFIMWSTESDWVQGITHAPSESQASVSGEPIYTVQDGRWHQPGKFTYRFMQPTSR